MEKIKTKVKQIINSYIKYMYPIVVIQRRRKIEERIDKMYHKIMIIMKKKRK